MACVVKLRSAVLVCTAYEFTARLLPAMHRPYCTALYCFVLYCLQVLPLLRDAAGMSVEVHMTQSPKHATQIVKGLPMDQVRTCGSKLLCSFHFLATM